MKVLFVCLGNACRSPMAEAIARGQYSHMMEASSAGLAPLGYIPDMTTQTLLKNGSSTDGLASKPVSRKLLDAADLVINMSGYPREQAFADSSKVEDWEVEDPYGEDHEIYQRIYEDIAARVSKLAEKIITKPLARETL